MTDDQILNKIGLSDGDLRDLLAKNESFFQQLNLSQQKVMASALPSASEAAATLGGGVTPDELTNFIKKRLPQHAASGGVFGSTKPASKP